MLLLSRRLEQQACLFVCACPNRPSINSAWRMFLLWLHSSTRWLCTSCCLMSNVRSLRTASVAVAARCWDTLSWPPLGSSTMMLSPSSSLLSSHG
jgi:hypothetical protein